MDDDVAWKVDLENKKEKSNLNFLHRSPAKSVKSSKMADFPLSQREIERKIFYKKVLKI